VRPLLALVAALVLGAAPASAARNGPCYREVFDGAGFTVCRYESAHDTVRLVWTGKDGAPVRRMARLADAAGLNRGQVRFAVNAGMYDEAGAPVGLYVEDGRQRHALNTRDGPGNFHLKPNGVFWIDTAGAAHVSTSEAYAEASPSPKLATQSGPMLLIDGALHPSIQPDGPSRNVRNGVCAASGGALFAISDRPVSFGKLARLFRDRLHCRDALYLDGTVSSLWSPALKRMDDSFELGPMLVVLNR
jgi:uncharacterized protein YigE (DUF2233 family)